MSTSNTTFVGKDEDGYIEISGMSAKIPAGAFNGGAFINTEKTTTQQSPSGLVSIGESFAISVTDSSGSSVNSVQKSVEIVLSAPFTGNLPDLADVYVGMYDPLTLEVIDIIRASSISLNNSVLQVSIQKSSNLPGIYQILISAESGQLPDVLWQSQTKVRDLRISTLLSSSAVATWAVGTTGITIDGYSIVIMTNEKRVSLGSTTTDQSLCSNSGFLLAKDATSVKLLNLQSSTSYFLAVCARKTQNTDVKFSLVTAILFTTSAIAATPTPTTTSVSAVADHLVLVAGNSQVQSPHTTLAVNPKVRVVDVSGNPVSGVTLTFIKSYGDFRITSPVQVSDSNGYAEVSVVLGFNSGYGEIQVTRKDSSLPDAAGSGNKVVRFSLRVSSSGNGTFANATDYTAGTWPEVIAIEDFDGDGIPDLAVTYDQVAGLAILIGNGDGTFQAKTDITVGNNPRAIVSGDFNSDGKLDLAVANNGDDTLSILIGNGNGTFATPVNYATSSGPTGMIVSDLNGDGRLDLAVTNGTTGNVGIFLGKGDGTFYSQTTTASQPNPGGIKASDFNKDGKVDLVVTNKNQNTLSVLLGNGDGTFQNPTSYNTATGPTSLVCDDFNRDGKIDLAVAEQTSGTIAVYFGNGDGTFGSPVSYNASSQPLSIISGDFNGDGMTDFAVGNYGSFTTGIFLGNGDGTFQNQVTYSISGNPGAMAAADLNANGKTDLVVLQLGQSAVSVLLGN